MKEENFTCVMLLTTAHEEALFSSCNSDAV